MRSSLVVEAAVPAAMTAPVGRAVAVVRVVTKLSAVHQSQQVLLFL
jgi:hypothetical protein